jgi:hypothetical protein
MHFLSPFYPFPCQLALRLCPLNTDCHYFKQLPCAPLLLPCATLLLLPLLAK